MRTMAMLWRGMALMGVASLLAFGAMAEAEDGEATDKAGEGAAKKGAGKKKAPSPVLAPIEDVAGLPRVLLIGDSISMGYTLDVRKLLGGKANVHRIPTNGGHTGKGVESIDAWLGDKPWDVIHFNWGLHDLKYMENDQPQVALDQYEKNLTALVERMKKTGAALIWASTTPYPEGVTPKRLVADAERYNAVAKKIMDANGVAIDDLFAAALPNLAQWQLPANVHFSPAGSAELAKPVAASIEAALAARKK